MGRGYGGVLGLVIAAGVFAAGLRSCGVIDVFVEALKGSSDLAKLGAAVGPYVLGVMTGSGDAAAFAFNEAVTPHAASFGMTIPISATSQALPLRSAASLRPWLPA